MAFRWVVVEATHSPVGEGPGTHASRSASGSGRPDVHPPLPPIAGALDPSAIERIDGRAPRASSTLLLNMNNRLLAKTLAQALDRALIHAREGSDRRNAQSADERARVVVRPAMDPLDHEEGESPLAVGELDRGQESDRRCGRTLRRSCLAPLEARTDLQGLWQASSTTA